MLERSRPAARAASSTPRAAELLRSYLEGLGLEIVIERRGRVGRRQRRACAASTLADGRALRGRRSCSSPPGITPEHRARRGRRARASTAACSSTTACAPSDPTIFAAGDVAEYARPASRACGRPRSRRPRSRPTTPSAATRPTRGIVPVTILKVVGIELTSIGRFERPARRRGDRPRGRRGGRYRKLVIADGRIVGAILLGYSARGRRRCAPRSPRGSTSPRTWTGCASGRLGACSRAWNSRLYPPASCAGMQPRSEPPRALAALAIAAGVPLAVPAAANAAVTPTRRRHTHAHPHRRRDRDNITLGVIDAGLHHPQLHRPARHQHRLRSGPGKITLPSNGRSASRSTPAPATTRSTCPAADLADVDDQRRRRATTSSSAATTSTRSTAATATTASPASAATRRSHGGDGNDVMIWNNGDGNDTNNGDAGVDETLITGATADDEMTVTPSRRAHPLRPHATRRSAST